MATDRATSAVFNVTFVGVAPTSARVGDVLEIAGRVTIKKIDADLVDVSGFGRDGLEFALGQIEVDLYSNDLKIDVAQ